MLISISRAALAAALFSVCAADAGAIGSIRINSGHSRFPQLFTRASETRVAAFKRFTGWLNTQAGAAFLEKYEPLKPLKTLNYGESLLKDQKTLHLELVLGSLAISESVEEQMVQVSQDARGADADGVGSALVAARAGAESALKAAVERLAAEHQKDADMDRGVDAMGDLETQLQGLAILYPSAQTLRASVQSARQELKKTAQAALLAKYAEEFRTMHNAPQTTGNAAFKRLQWVLDYAKKGVPAAQLEAAMNYFMPQDGVLARPDNKKGREWLELAAKNGEPAAALRLGDFHRTGMYGFEQDLAAAEAYYKKAAAAGIKDAQVRLQNFTGAPAASPRAEPPAPAKNASKPPLDAGELREMAKKYDFAKMMLARALKSGTDEEKTEGYFWLLRIKDPSLKKDSDALKNDYARDVAPELLAAAGKLLPR